MAKDLFRKVSLERLYSPEQLDRLLNVISLKGWIALGFVVFFTALVLFWSVVGSIPIIIEGRGILYDPDGIFNVQSISTGYVKQIPVQTGDLVKKGDVLAILENPELQRQYEDESKVVTFLSSEISRLEKELQSKQAMKKETLERQLQLQEEILKDEQKKLSLLTKEQEILDQQIVINAQGALIAALKNELALEGYSQTLESKKLQLMEKQSHLDQLQGKIDALKIVAPQTSIVLEGEVNVHDRMTPGSTLMWLQKFEDPPEKQQIHGFFPLQVGERMQKGMQAKISFDSVDRQKYGMMLGEVLHVFPYGAPLRQELLQASFAKSLFNFLTEDEATSLVIIKPQHNPNTPSGFSWTIGDGPPHLVRPGSVGTVEVELAEKKPISYILPIFRED